MSLLDTGYDNFANFRNGMFVATPIGTSSVSQQAIEPGYNSFGVYNTPFNFTNTNLITNPTDTLPLVIPRYLIFRVLSPSSNNTVSSSVGGDLEMPIKGTISEIGAFVDTAGTTGTETVDVNLNGTTTMNSNKITIDSGEKSSRTATSQPILTNAAVEVGDIVTVDIDAVQTTKAKGLSVRFTLT